MRLKKLRINSADLKYQGFLTIVAPQKTKKIPSCQLDSGPFAAILRPPDASETCWSTKFP